MGFLRRADRDSRMEKIKNYVMGEQMEVQNNMLDEITDNLHDMVM